MGDQLKGVDLSQGTVVVEAPNGRQTLRVAYFFSGIKRKASIANFLKEMRINAKVGLCFHEIDILVGGSEHDLMDKATQEEWLSKLRGGEFDIAIFSPPCGSWSRANWANGDGPKPCGSRRYPWGIAHLRQNAQRRAQMGNEFIHFSIGAIAHAQLAKRKGFQVRCVLEHPEDLGRMSKGEPVSIWQLPEIRTAFDGTPFVTVAATFRGLIKRSRPA